MHLQGGECPCRPEWIHEIKHDGYRLIVQRDAKRVRLWTRHGQDWSGRFPLIAEAALRNRNSSFVIDGEAVLLGVDGRSARTSAACLLPMRKASLARLLAQSRRRRIPIRLRAGRDWSRSIPASDRRQPTALESVKGKMAEIVNTHLTRFRLTLGFTFLGRLNILLNVHVRS